MRTEHLNYSLPPELIAQHPADVRSDSRLLVLRRKNNELIDSQFSSISDFLLPGDCLVVNDTKVLPARFFAQREKGGGSLEGLFLSENQPAVWEVMLKGLRKVKFGEIINLKSRTQANFCRAEVLDKMDDGVCRLKIEHQIGTETILNEIGFPPLPPYIKRTNDMAEAMIDRQRYQTVYAQKVGAIAAPTAGLHFTDELICRLKEKGIYFGYITLHVGVGTFKPVSTDNLEDHQMHGERFSVSQETADLINNVKKRNGRIIAVGTTSVRTLETVASGSKIEPANGTANLFITPGYKFKIIDAMITNFHLPKSTLLALVSAFAGLENILNAYGYAIEKRYRFYSYGDAMLIQ